MTIQTGVLQNQISNIGNETEPGLQDIQARESHRQTKLLNILQNMVSSIVRDYVRSVHSTLRGVATGTVTLTHQVIGSLQIVS